MRRRLVALFACALVTTGSLFSIVTHEAETMDVDPENVEVPFGALAMGTSAGTNATNATITLLGALTPSLADALHLNNTNATGTWHVRVAVASATGVDNLQLLQVGVTSGGQSHLQVEFKLGVLSQSTGALVALAPGSANTLYVRQDLYSLGILSSVTLDVYATQQADESSYVLTVATLQLV